MKKITTASLVAIAITSAALTAINYTASEYREGRTAGAQGLCQDLGGVWTGGDACELPQPELAAQVELEPETVPEPEPIKTPTNHSIDADLNGINLGELWDGELVGSVIICPKGLDVAYDIAPSGHQWAACM